MAHANRNHRFDLSPDVYRVGEMLHAAGGRPILVGGWVRDTLLGIAHRQDFDIEVFGLPMGRLRSILGRIGPVHAVGRHFGVLKLKTRQAEYDISVPRRESNIGKGHRGFLVEPDPTMRFEEAAARRDFTINAMGYAFLEGELLDPHNGEADLQARVLRHVGPAFGEDPLRVLRAMQFAGRFALTIAPETLAMCRSQDLAELPRERTWVEFQKLLLKSARPSNGLAYVEPLGILPYFPELARLHAGQAGDDGWARTLAMVDAAADLRTGDDAADRVLMAAALTHAMTPGVEAHEEAAARTFLERLTNEGAFIEAVMALLAELETPQALYGRRADVQPGHVRRLALRQRLPFLLRAATALHRARHGDADFPAAAWLEGEARRLGVWERPPEPLLMGRHVMERGVPRGPAIGKWVRRAFERQLDGGIATLDEALAWLDAQLAEGGRAKGDGAEGDGAEGDGAERNRGGAGAGSRHPRRAGGGGP